MRGFDSELGTNRHPNATARFVDLNLRYIEGIGAVQMFGKIPVEQVVDTELDLPVFLGPPGTEDIHGFETGGLPYIQATTDGRIVIGAHLTGYQAKLCPEIPFLPRVIGR